MFDRIRRYIKGQPKFEPPRSDFFQLFDALSSQKWSYDGYTEKAFQSNLERCYCFYKGAIVSTRINVHLFMGQVQMVVSDKLSNASFTIHCNEREKTLILDLCAYKEKEHREKSRAKLLNIV